jgi:hypothetical protein
MALPNPGMDAVPFTPLTAEFLDDMIENIESLSAGTGFGSKVIGTGTLADSAVTTAKLADANVTTAKLASSAVTNAKIQFATTVDANGWSIYNYGSYKIYRKVSSQSSISIAAADRTSFANISLPVGMSTLGTRQVHATIRGSSYPGNFSVGVIAGSSDTVIQGLVSSNYNGGTLLTGAFGIDVTISEL